MWFYELWTYVSPLFDFLSVILFGDQSQDFVFALVRFIINHLNQVCSDIKDDWIEKGKGVWWVNEPLYRLNGPKEWVSGWGSEWMNEWMSEWMSEWVSEWVGEWVSGWMSECVSECVNEWMSEWVNEWVSGWISDYYYWTYSRRMKWRRPSLSSWDCGL